MRVGDPRRGTARIPQMGVDVPAHQRRQLSGGRRPARRPARASARRRARRAGRRRSRRGGPPPAPAPARHCCASPSSRGSNSPRCRRPSAGPVRHPLHPVPARPRAPRRARGPGAYGTAGAAPERTAGAGPAGPARPAAARRRGRPAGDPPSPRTWRASASRAAGAEAVGDRCGPAGPGPPAPTAPGRRPDRPPTACRGRTRTPGGKPTRSGAGHCRTPRSQTEFRSASGTVAVISTGRTPAPRSVPPTTRGPGPPGGPRPARPVCGPGQRGG